MVPAITDPRSVMDAAVCALRNQGEKAQRRAGGGADASVGQTSKGEGRDTGRCLSW